MKKKTLLVLSSLFLLTSCNGGQIDNSSGGSIPQNSSSSSVFVEDSSSSTSDLIESSSTGDNSSDSSSSSGEEELLPLAPYTPTTFSESTYSITTKNIVDGVDLVKVSYNLNNGAAIVANIIEADPTKVTIAAGTKDNTTANVDAGTMSYSVPYSQAIAYAKATGKTFYAVTNADFFGNYKPVNAFVKDNVIVKSAHNGDLNDVPVSKPMLFGVNDEGKAQIAPIVKNKTHSSSDSSTISEGFKYGLDMYNSENKLFRTTVVVDKKASDTEIGLILNNWVDVSRKRILIEVTKDEGQQGLSKFTGTISKITKQTSTSTIGAVLSSKKAYISLPESYEGQYAEGDKVYAGYITTSDGTWHDYNTVLGCRHSLVENGVLPESLSSETSNGATSRVPRTAVGIKENGNVVIISIEDLHYNSSYRAEHPDVPCTGLTITQLADLLRYYGCRDAANFDGGGSSQLVTLGDSGYEVITRSSDTQSTDPSSTRKVVNSIIVAEK